MPPYSRIRPRVIFLLLPALLLLMACGTDATPVRRFTAAQVVATFRGFGLPTEDPHPLSAEIVKYFYGDVPLGHGQVVNFLNRQNTGASGDLLVFDNAADQETAWAYLQEHPIVNYFVQRSQLRNANLILVFFYVSNTPPPELTTYDAAFIGLR